MNLVNMSYSFSLIWHKRAQYLTNNNCYVKIVCILFCSTQDGESADINCLEFWEHFQNGKILIKRQVYNKGIFTNLGYFFTIWNIDIIRVYSWFWVNRCNYFCCIMFDFQVMPSWKWPKSFSIRLQQPKYTQKYLNNPSCYDKSFVSFCSSCNGESTQSLNVLSTLQKWQNFDETLSL